VVPVQVLYQDSDLMLISGPKAGDVLVSDGQSRLKAGSRVEVLRDNSQDPKQQRQTATLESAR